MKTCKKCKQEKSLSEFSHKRPKNRKPGLQPHCKECAIEDTRDWRLKQSTDRLKDLYYKRTYNITLKDFNNRFIIQEGKCLLCKKELNVFGISGDRACVDHCHTTGMIRGILCNECNRGLGYFKDNIMTLQNAIQYLSEEGLSSQGGQ